MNYVAFFRGINVGGKNLVKMAELSKLFAALGYENVKTYIQSGNVVFSSYDTEMVAAERIRAAFAQAFGFECAVLLRSDTEVERIVLAIPFEAEEIARAEAESPEVEHLYVYLLDAPTDEPALTQLLSDHGSGDLLRLGPRSLYLLCSQSIRDSKLAVSLARLKTPMTARNMKTMRRIHEMLLAVREA